MGCVCVLGVVAARPGLIGVPWSPHKPTGKRGLDVLSAVAKRDLLSLSGRHGAEINRAARTGQLRLDSCGWAARRAMQARRWDAMQCIWYVRVLERCHRRSGAHLLKEGHR
jgi:hypothetical protein